MQAAVLAVAGALLAACASYDVHSHFFTSHTSRVAFIPALYPEPRPDTSYVENETWMVDGQYFHLNLGHDSSLVSKLFLSKIPAEGETLLVTDTSKSYLWVGGKTASSQRSGTVVGIAYADSGGLFEGLVRQHPKGHNVTGRWAVRYRLEWKDPADRSNWLQGEARILRTRYRVKDDSFN